MSIDILFDPSSSALGAPITFVCWGIDFAGPAVRAYDIDDIYNLITAIAEYGEDATDSSRANRVRMSVLGRRVHSAYGSEYAHSRDAISRRHRMAKDPEPTLPDARGG